MKYRDKNTLRFQENQLKKVESDKIGDLSNRNARRKELREFKEFSQTITDKFWWVSLTDVERNSIYHNYKWELSFKLRRDHPNPKEIKFFRDNYLEKMRINYPGDKSIRIIKEIFANNELTQHATLPTSSSGKIRETFILNKWSLTKNKYIMNNDVCKELIIRNVLILDSENWSTQESHYVLNSNTDKLNLPDWVFDKLKPTLREINLNKLLC